MNRIYKAQVFGSYINNTRQKIGQGKCTVTKLLSVLWSDAVTRQLEQLLIKQ